VSLRLWPREEKFLLIDIRLEQVRLFKLGIGPEKEVVLTKIGEAAEFGGMVLPKHLPDRAIVAASFPLAYTSFLPINLIRDNPAEPLKATELQNLLSRSVGRLFVQCRDEARKELKMEDAEIILAGSRVTKFKVDGHAVVNPIGFRCRNVHALLELTLTSRSVWSVLKALKLRQIFFVERERSICSVFRKIDPHTAALLSVGNNDSFLFGLADPERPMRRFLDWRPDIVYAAVGRAFGTDNETSRKLYELYIKGSVSPRFKQKMSKVVDPGFRELFSKLPPRRSEIYIESFVPLASGRRFQPSGIAARKIENKFGIRYGGEVDFPLLAPFLEFYYDKSDSQINHWLKRHLHWIGS